MYMQNSRHHAVLVELYAQLISVDVHSIINHTHTTARLAQLLHQPSPLLFGLLRFIAGNKSLHIGQNLIKPKKKS